MWTDGFSLPFENWCQRTQHPFLWLLTHKQDTEIPVKEFREGSYQSWTFQDNPKWPVCPLICHISYRTRYFFSINSVYSACDHTSSNFDPHLFSTFMSLSIRSFQISFRSFTPTTPISVYPSNITLFPCSLFHSFKWLTTMTTGINLFHCSRTARSIAIETILLVSVFIPHHISLSSFFWLYVQIPNKSLYLLTATPSSLFYHHVSECLGLMSV